MIRKLLQLFFIFLIFNKINSSENENFNTNWNVKFPIEKLVIHMDEEVLTNFTLKLSRNLRQNEYFQLNCDNKHLADILENEKYRPNADKEIFSNFTIQGIFLGNTKIYLNLYRDDKVVETSKDEINLIVIRKVRVIDHVFTGSVALLVSILYINFGCALDLTVLKGILMRPVGPVIGFIGQFIVMPVLSYALGYILFPDNVEMQLGLFFTGVSPGGGASNIWTVILHGNINLSIVMTTISNLAAFGMMPLWIFTLGKVIFDRGNLGIPYEKIATFAIALIIPLGIGILIQKFLPRVSRILVRLLKPISILLILFIVIFAIVTNLYLFELFSWQIVLAGLGLPWLGYTLSWCAAKLLKQNGPDALAISVETGVQNTGIAIFLLRFALDQPQADLTTVIPVSVAIMTPLPLFMLAMVQKCFKKKNETETEESIIKSDIS